MKMDETTKKMIRIAFAKNLIEIMKLKNITDRQLSKGIGVDVRTIRRWINADGAPNIGQLIPLANYLEYSIDDLTGL